MSITSVLAALGLCYWIECAECLHRIRRRVPVLHALRAVPAALATVSVLLAARDEGAHAGETLDRLLLTQPRPTARDRGRRRPLQRRDRRRDAGARPHGPRSRKRLVVDRNVPGSNVLLEGVEQTIRG